MVHVDVKEVPYKYQPFRQPGAYYFTDAIYIFVMPLSLRMVDIQSDSDPVTAHSFIYPVIVTRTGTLF